MNDSPEISPSILWDTGKTVIRGTIISYSTHKKKQQKELENTLEQKIKHLTNQLSLNRLDDMQTELKNSQRQLDSMIQRKTQFCIQHLWAHLHANWSCQPVNFLWTSITKTLSTIWTVESLSPPYFVFWETLLLYPFHRNLKIHYLSP